MKLFQFDYDLTFAVFFLNADRTIYARYGTRSGHDADKDVALEGLAETMRSVLEIHKGYPGNKNTLTGKQPAKTSDTIPEKFSSLTRFKSKLNYDGQVAKSCIHCHQVRDAQRVEFRDKNQPLPEQLLYPFPSARLLGLEFEKSSRATVATVAKKSAAAIAGIRAGDILESLNGTRVDSEADIHWQLHQLDSSKASQRILSFDLKRAGKPESVEVKLNPDWRKAAVIDWRPTSWDLRRMATGGMTLKPLSDEERKRLKIPADKMALRADHVGRYGNHARAMRAGIRKNDVIVSFAGRSDLMSESALIEYAIQQRKNGDVVQIQYLRNGNSRRTQIKLQ